LRKTTGLNGPSSKALSEILLINTKY
jgi:hypothetical protein